MRRAEGVVHVNIRHLGELLGEYRIIGFFLVVITDILEQQHAAGRKFIGKLLDFFADAIVRKVHFATEQFSKASSHGAQRHGGFALALRTTHVGREDQARALFDEQTERREGFLDARFVGDDHLAILFVERHIVIHAHENAFAMNIEVADRELCHKS